MFKLFRAHCISQTTVYSQSMVYKLCVYSMVWNAAIYSIYQSLHKQLFQMIDCLLIWDKKSTNTFFTVYDSLYRLRIHETVWRDWYSYIKDIFRSSYLFDSQSLLVIWQLKKLLVIRQLQKLLFNRQSKDC
jgi:hypothetical protein